MAADPVRRAAQYDPNVGQVPLRKLPLRKLVDFLEGELLLDPNINFLPGWNPALQATVPLVAALPSATVDGQEIYYTPLSAGGQGAVWHLKYNAASISAYKWEFLGGTPLHTSIAASENRNNVAYGDLATVGPKIVIPLAGEYHLHFGAQMEDNAQQRIFMSPSFDDGATLAADGNAAVAAIGQALVGNTGASTSRFMRRDGQAVATIRWQYRAAIATASNTFALRWATAVPVRVG